MNLEVAEQPGHRCFGDDELLELALGRVSQHAALGLLAEVERCPDCSLVLAEVGRAVALEARDPDEASPLGGMFRAVRAGDVLDGRFEIVRALGAGGMGEVYEAVDVELGERLALKTIRAGLAQTQDRIERLKQEIRLARRVVHPNVCRVLEFGRDDSAQRTCYFLTMELLSGELLSERLRRKQKLAVDEVLRIADDLCAGLAAIQAEGILHRDIKTNNVMLCADDRRRAGPPGEHAVLLDFGIARSVEPRDAALTTGGVVGTPEYMAPEQLRGEALSPSTDVYALGVVLFELLVGHLPFPGEESMARLIKRLDAKAPRPRAYLPALPACVDELVAFCLEPRASDRPRDAKELRSALSAARDGTFTRPVRHGSALGAPTGDATPAVPATRASVRPVRRLGLALASVLGAGSLVAWATLPSPQQGASQAPGVSTGLATTTPSAASPAPTAILTEANVAPTAPVSAVPAPETARSELPSTRRAVRVRGDLKSKPAPKRTRTPEPGSADMMPNPNRCSPPYYYDERGLRVYRKDCL